MRYNRKRTLEEALIVRNMKIKELNISCYYCDTEPVLKEILI